MHQEFQLIQCGHLPMQTQQKPRIRQDLALCRQRVNYRSPECIYDFMSSSEIYYNNQTGHLVYVTKATSLLSTIFRQGIQKPFPELLA